MSYHTRSKSKQIAEKLAELTNIDPGLSDESGGESDTDEFPPGNQSSAESEQSDNSDVESEDEAESESDAEASEDDGKETAADGTIWIKTSLSDSAVQKRVGRVSAQGIIKVIPGPTPFAKRKISSITTAFESMVDDEFLDHIRKCTETEAHRCMGNMNWSLSLKELKAFIAVLYARGAMGLKNISVTHIFSTKYGPELIRGTMSRDRFKSIMRYLRFDFKETRPERLLTR
ncbi:uncharacterized protein LOC119066540 isoform X2 [Bradysia coprophila]|uniref:uncharacterized protein LOC119066540 isoform X2 n=1 Tax=Bradysia coprophila TaxID=38358 RepID=UPI00187D89A5|nr:uncharacterized protein LOC119066540 isoform X2 [Bradysia coprophila]